ncbi:MAG: DUF721 domain-containing protein [Treponema sp.]|jgi:hypothetical protein|nr:DUF721 domain-containing protein [Treponema sp.]
MKRAGEYLTAIIDADLFKKARTYSGFFSSWERICQDCGIAAAAGHSRIRELERGILVVEADHPGWIQILQTKAQWILGCTRRYSPELDIRGISLTLSRSGAPDRAPDPQAESLPEHREEPKEEPKREFRGESAPKPGTENGRGAWERVEDKSFRDSLKRLEQGIREREKSGPKGPGRPEKTGRKK